MNCSVCGAENEADARFCAECGAPLEAYPGQDLDATIAGRPDDDDFDDATILSPRSDIEAQLREVSIAHESSVAEDDSISEPDLPPEEVEDDIPAYTSGAQATTDDQPPPQAGDNNRKLIMIVGLVLAVLILCCCCFSLIIGGLIGSNPELLDELGNLANGLPSILGQWPLS